MKTRTPVEVTTRHATTVDTLQEAFAFVMGLLDEIGEAPRIAITPMTSRAAGSEGERFFEVSVSTHGTGVGE